MLTPMDGASVRPTEGEAATRIRVLLVDDHAVVRRGLRGFFELLDDIEIVGEAEDGAQAVALVEQHQPDVVLMDLLMPVMDGIAATAEIKQRWPDVEVVALTSFIEEERVTAALEAGATGYLLKDAPRTELLRAVRAAARGESVLSPSVASRVLGRVRRPSNDEPDDLSPRELEILGLVARGTTNREAAKRLFISEATVKTHLLHIYAKLGVNDRAAAVAVGFDRGLLTPKGR